jgi:hypothetical protein
MRFKTMALSCMGLMMTTSLAMAEEQPKMDMQAMM